MAEPEIVEEPEFKWGRKSGKKGVNSKGVSFYESFTYDDVEYLRYDCVYIYEKGVEEPSVGKLLKMWETCDKKKNGKVLWFFRPSEISNFVVDEEFLENELLLASGEGSGLFNINSLEAIAGKSNVVCISKDDRNRQPTHEEIANADYVFRRTFDVGCCKINDDMGETIARTDVKFLVNRLDDGAGCSTTKDDSGRKEVGENGAQNNSCVVASVGDISKQSEGVKTNGHCDIITKEPADLNELSAKPESSNAIKTKDNVTSCKDLLRSNGELKNSGDGKGKHVRNSVVLDDRPSKRTKLSSDANSRENVVPTASTTDEDEVRPPKDSSETKKVFLKKPERGDKIVSNSQQRKVRSDQANDETVQNEGQDLGATDEDEVKSRKDSFGTEKVRLKRLKRGKKIISDSRQLKVHSAQANDKDSKKEGQELGATDEDEVEPRDSSGTEKVSSKELKHGDKLVSNGQKRKVRPEQAVDKKEGQDFGATDEDDQSGKDSSWTERVSSKKLKRGDKIVSGAQQRKLHSEQAEDGDLKEEGQEFRETDEDEIKPRIDSSGTEKISQKKLKRGDKIFNNREQAKYADIKKEGFEAGETSTLNRETPKPEADKSKWFGGLPWEDRIKSAHEKGRLVLLQNLDPSFTSAEVEEIVRQGFKESCSAKMIQRVAVSSPHFGQAFVIFNGKDIADRVVKKLINGCLLLPNGRPLLGRKVTPSFAARQSAFNGHLCIKRIQHVMIQEQREAVSTSHCSQPNTVEYDMALEWFLLQQRSSLEWKNLYEKHAQDLRELKAELKRR